MIDLSALKAPGWQRIVAELNAPAPDDKVYLERLLRVLAQVSGARQAVLYVPDRTDGEEVEPRVVVIWPPPELDKDAEAAAQSAGPSQTQILFANEARTAARVAFGTAQARAFGLDKQELYYGEGKNEECILAVPITGHVASQQARAAAATAQGQAAIAAGGSVVEVPQAVATLIVEPRSKDAVRSSLAMAEVLAGYISGHQARSALKRTQLSTFALDLATRLIASVNNAPNFKGASMQLCNDLAKQFAVDRVALGWVVNDVVRVQALSDIEHFDRRTQMVQKLANAMDECLDQEQPILFPAPPADGEQGDVLLSQAIVHAHRELAAGNAKLRVCSLPLRDTSDTPEGQVVGVVTIEHAGDGAIDLNTIELMQAAMDLIAPMLKTRRNDDRALPLRAWDSLRRSAAWFVGPKHTVWKLVGILTISVFLFLTFYKTTYRPSAEATLEPRVRRVVSAPFDGVVKRVGDKIEPGAKVVEGQILAWFDTNEYELGLIDALGKIEQARTQAAAARKAKDQSKVAQADQQEARAIAEAEIYRYRMNKSTIVAPISGTIIIGELSDRVGATMKTGDMMFQIAALDDIIVTSQVDERDIALVRDAYTQGRGTGEIATKAKPNEAVKFTIERIVPLAVASEGKNTFEVRGKLEGETDWFRPGIEGVAKFNTERRSLLWIGTRRVLDQLRLWLWW